MGGTVVRVLVVEDNPGDHELLLELFDALGDPSFELHHVGRLQDAIGFVTTSPADIVLLDLGLPDGSGVECVQRLIEASNTVPIVVLSGQGHEEVALAALHLGAEDYLEKGTFDEKLLRRTIRYAVERHRARAALSKLTDDLRVSNERLEQLVDIDPLTELLNRRGLQEALSHEIQCARTNGTELLAILIDLDDFKRINDTFGHSVGDVVLKHAAQKLKGSLRGTDHVGRIGGDEFLILLPHTKAAEAWRLAERIRLAVADAVIVVTQGPIRVTASLGVVKEVSPVIDELLARMHLVLRDSKRDGKNRVCLDWGYSSNSASAAALLDMVQNLHSPERLVRGPPADSDCCSSNDIVGYEFLSRSTFKSFEMPSDFFRACTEGNILTVVDHACLRVAIQAAAQLPDWMCRHVNIFPSTLIDVPTRHLLEDFPTSMRPGSFCAELSEEQIVGHPAHLVQKVQALREAGIKIALDDVGFGRSCLENLFYLSPDVIKVDKGITVGIANDLGRRAVMQRLLKMLAPLEAEVIVEGIENDADLEVLKTMGVALGQGYFLGRPE